MLPEIPFFEGFWYFVAVLLGMIAWRIWGERVRAALRRFDQRRRDADLQACFDRMNPNAHFRQSVDQISDATPAVEPFATAEGAADPRAVWNGEIYATREEAEAARWRHVITEARMFYIDLDRAYNNRIRSRARGDTLRKDNDGEP
jgi:hypothetical protein